MQTERSHLTKTVTMSGHFRTCVALLCCPPLSISPHSFALCRFVFLLRYNRRPSFLCYLTTAYQLQEMFSSKQNTSVLMRLIDIHGSLILQVLAYIRILSDIRLSKHEELQSY